MSAWVMSGGDSVAITIKRTMHTNKTHHTTNRAHTNRHTLNHLRNATQFSSAQGVSFSAAVDAPGRAGDWTRARTLAQDSPHTATVSE